jgi:molybdopterin synthase catalytic subunit
MKKKHTAIIDVRIQSDDFDVTKENKKLQNDEPGAIVNFVGIVRGFDEKKNESIKSLTLEHYPGMTELEIENIVNESCERWSVSCSDSYTQNWKIITLRSNSLCRCCFQT